MRKMGKHRNIRYFRKLNPLSLTEWGEQFFRETMRNRYIYSIEEVAKAFGMSVISIRAHCIKGDISCRKVGNNWFIPKTFIRDFLGIYRDFREAIQKTKLENYGKSPEEKIIREGK